MERLIGTLFIVAMLMVGFQLVLKDEGSAMSPMSTNSGGTNGPDPYPFRTDFAGSATGSPNGPDPSPFPFAMPGGDGGIQGVPFPFLTSSIGGPNGPDPSPFPFSNRGGDDTDVYPWGTASSAGSVTGGPNGPDPTPFPFAMLSEDEGTGPWPTLRF